MISMFSGSTENNLIGGGAGDDEDVAGFEHHVARDDDRVVDGVAGDLAAGLRGRGHSDRRRARHRRIVEVDEQRELVLQDAARIADRVLWRDRAVGLEAGDQIGRASCRERV